MYAVHLLLQCCNTDYLRVENLVQTTVRFSTVQFEMIFNVFKKELRKKCFNHHCVKICFKAAGIFSSEAAISGKEPILSTLSTLLKNFFLLPLFQSFKGKLEPRGIFCQEWSTFSFPFFFQNCRDSNCEPPLANLIF